MENREKLIGSATEIIDQKPYREHIYKEREGSRLWEFFSYDKDGNLLWGPRFYGSDGKLIQDGIPIVDLVKKFGHPLEIVDPVISQIRAKQWVELFDRVIGEVGYRSDGHLESFATKAAPAAEILVATLGAGWHPETSSEQDLYNLHWLWKQGLFAKETRIVSNGYKFPPENYIPTDAQKHLETRSYAEMICDLRKLGLNTVPIIDSLSEVDFFNQKNVPPMEVGVRFKAYGKKRGLSFGELPARHGEVDVEKIAKQIESAGKHKLTTFHAMISAFDSQPVDEFVESLFEAADVFFDIRKNHPSLEVFNIGGGIPTMSSNYNHEEFLGKLLTGLKERSLKLRQKMPKVEVEFGTYIAAEAGVSVMQIENIKINGVEKDGKVVPWGVVKGSFIRSIVDEWLLNVRYTALAGNYANNPSRLMRLGDATCDKQGILLTNEPRGNTVFLPLVPNITKDLLIVISEQQAYEEILTGIGAVGHCQLAEAKDIIIVRGSDGRIIDFIVQNNQNPDRTRKLLGFTQQNMDLFRNLLDPRSAWGFYQGNK